MHLSGICDASEEVEGKEGMLLTNTYLTVYVLNRFISDNPLLKCPLLTIFALNVSLRYIEF